MFLPASRHNGLGLDLGNIITSENGAFLVCISFSLVKGSIRWMLQSSLTMILSHNPRTHMNVLSSNFIINQQKLHASFLLSTIIRLIKLGDYNSCILNFIISLVSICAHIFLLLSMVFVSILSIVVSGQQVIRIVYSWSLYKNHWNMEGNERRQGSNPHDPSVKRRSPDSGLSSSDRLQEESMSSSSFDSATPGVQRMQTSNMLAGSSSAAGTGEIFERRIRQRTIPNPENLVSSAPIAPEQRGQHSGELNTEQGGQQNNRSLQLRGSLPQRDPTRNPGWIIIIPDTALAGRVPQVGDPRVRTRLISEVC